LSFQRGTFSAAFEFFSAKSAKDLPAHLYTFAYRKSVHHTLMAKSLDWFFADGVVQVADGVVHSAQDAVAHGPAMFESKIKPPTKRAAAPAP
jgi:hypothetical protein